MTDILLDSTNDLSIIDGQLLLVQTKEELTRQKLLNRLRSFTGTLFTNINYGINVDVAFGKNTQEALSQNIKTLIATTSGIVKLVSFSSEVSVDRVYRCKFTYELETGSIEGLDVPIGSSTTTTTGLGIWQNGAWVYQNIWDANEIWGGVLPTPDIPNNSLSLGGNLLTLNGDYLTLGNA